MLILVVLLTFVASGSGLHSLAGQVGSGNYSYYVLKYEGPILLELKTHQGDADLYISSQIEHPTFDLDEHDISSWTCGQDSLFIPKSFGRPINIGVYGYPRFENSKFTLTATFLEDDLEASGEHEQENDYSKYLTTTLVWLLEILVEILSAL